MLAQAKKEKDKEPEADSNLEWQVGITLGLWVKLDTATQELLGVSDVGRITAVF